MRKRKLGGLFFALCCAVIALAGCKQKVETIKVGGIFPLTGEVAVYGVEARNGIELAISEINNAGGVLGKPLELISEDDEGKPEISVNAFNKLTAKDKVQFIIGSLTSGCTKAFTTKAQAQKVVLIAPAATAADITDAGDFVFRACFIDPFQGTVGGQFASVNLEAKTAAVLFNVSNDYSVGLKDNFVSTFTANGGTVIATESYNDTDVDFSAQITKITSSDTKVDVIYLPDYYTKVALIVAKLNENGVKASLIGGDGWDGITDKVGDSKAVLGGFYSNHYAADSTEPVVQNFVSSYKAKYGSVPVSFAALGYDSVYLLRDAIIRADNGRSSADKFVLPSSTEVKNALAVTSGDYLTGNLSFDAKHNPVKSAVIVEIVEDSNGKLTSVYKATIDPQ